jgi:Fe-S cluster assembly iron-binding protein IscA
MAIKDTSRKPYIQDNNTNVKIGIDLPIRRDDGGDGYFASTSTTIEAVKNNIRNLLQTNEGERFGVQNAIMDKFEFWLPFVEVRNIEVLSNDDDSNIGMNEIRVKILFNIKQDPNTLDSVTLDFNSEISEGDR